LDAFFNIFISFLREKACKGRRLERNGRCAIWVSNLLSAFNRKYSPALSRFVVGIIHLGRKENI